MRNDRRIPALALLALLALCTSACAIIKVRSESSSAPAPAPAQATLRIYLARHGQTDWNAARRLQGQTDTELNATGREQAAKLRVRIEGLPLDHVYSSTLKRSRETAEIARGSTPLTSLPGLMEQHVGKFEGVVIDDKNPEARAEFDRRSHIPDDTLDGGESDDQLVARVRTTIDSIRAERRTGSILIVGHGGTNRAILRVLLDLTGEQAAKIQQANDELYLIERAPGANPRLWKWIDNDHLSEL